MKSILVSGAGSGIGQAIAVKLARLDWSVILMGRNEKNLNGTLDLLEHSAAHHIAVADICGARWAPGRHASGRASDTSRPRGCQLGRCGLASVRLVCGSQPLLQRG